MREERDGAEGCRKEQVMLYFWQKEGDNMELGLTWPLQRFLKKAVPYGVPRERKFCWDAHCITLHGRRSLLLVHCESRYTCVRFDLSALEWEHLQEIALEEIRCGLLEAGIEEAAVEQYLMDAGAVSLTRTHGRREVAFLNRAWEDVLSCDMLVDQSTNRQPALQYAVNSRLCRCAGEDGLASAREHLTRLFAKNT